MSGGACKRCGGVLITPRRIAEELRRLPERAKGAKELEPENAPAEDIASAVTDFMEMEIERLACELDGICSKCWVDAAGDVSETLARPALIQSRGRWIS